MTPWTSTWRKLVRISLACTGCQDPAVLDASEMPSQYLTLHVSWHSIAVGQSTRPVLMPEQALRTSVLQSAAQPSPGAQICTAAHELPLDCASR